MNLIVDADLRLARFVGERAFNVGEILFRGAEFLFLGGAVRTPESAVEFRTGLGDALGESVVHAGRRRDALYIDIDGEHRGDREDTIGRDFRAAHAPFAVDLLFCLVVHRFQYII